MKREEHYCDRCGQQMTTQDCEGDTTCFGVTVLAQKATESHTINAGVVVDTNVKTGCGSSATRHQLHGTEFCSFFCFKSSMTALIDAVDKTMMSKSS